MNISMSTDKPMCTWFFVAREIEFLDYDKDVNIIDP